MEFSDAVEVMVRLTVVPSGGILNIDIHKCNALLCSYPPHSDVSANSLISLHVSPFSRVPHVPAILTLILPSEQSFPVSGPSLSTEG